MISHRYEGTSVNPLARPWRIRFEFDDVESGIKNLLIATLVVETCSDTPLDAFSGNSLTFFCGHKISSENKNVLWFRNTLVALYNYASAWNVSITV